MILFQVPPEQIDAAEAIDAAGGRRGLDLLRRHRPRPASRASTTRRGSAPGRPAARSRCASRATASSCAPGSRIVMQVHYNLLAGDVARRLRGPAATGSRRRATWSSSHTMLLPAPVELPCRAEHADGPLCDRDAAMFDVMERFGPEGSRTANALYLLCGGEPEPGPGAELHPHRPRADDHPRRRRPHAPARSRDQHRDQPGHRPGARRVLDIPVWNFDDQGARDIEPVTLSPATPSRSPASTSSGCATSCRPSRASPTATSCGARAPPTRCAWGCCRSRQSLSTPPAGGFRAA